MVRKTKEEALETRQDILEAAAKVFAEKGVAKSSLDQIAKEAGVTRGAVYWHFSNKAGIFEALHESLNKPLTDTILKDLEKNHPHPLEQLEELCVQLLKDVHNNAHKQRVLKIFCLKCDYSGELEEFLKEQSDDKRRSLMLFEKYITRAKEKGHIPECVNAERATMALMCYMSGLVTESLRHPDFINLEKLSEELVHQFFVGLLPRT